MMLGVDGDGDDVRERLLPAETRDLFHGNGSTFTYEELLHSIGSFSAVVWPVIVTMLLASLRNWNVNRSFVSLHVVDQASAQALAEAYLVYEPGKNINASTGTKVLNALVNALAIVSFFLVATFVIVFCYKFNLNKVRIL
ncbi:hypothetical protein PsorP6_008421 [Peronosclerospora sorghi]|uniref:Uncharacterized protein n=1 Tax=Peronosclerospora sorghi TaxID=230839 RepID=A0ACC0WBX9_9STRA|nr:hypothetical protein PsorP6_008421 [Peronosclerospora sorghi]